MARAHGCPRQGTEGCRDSSLTSCVFTVPAGHPGCPVQHHDGELWEWDVWYLGVWCSGRPPFHLLRGWGVLSCYSLWRGKGPISVILKALKVVESIKEGPQRSTKALCLWSYSYVNTPVRGRGIQTWGWPQLQGPSQLISSRGRVQNGFPCATPETVLVMSTGLYHWTNRG